MNFPTEQELAEMPINRLRNIDIMNQEEEAMVQAALDARITEQPLVQAVKRNDIPDIFNGEDEAKWQKIVDERTEALRPKPGGLYVSEDDEVIGLVQQEELDALEEDIAKEEVKSLPVEDETPKEVTVSIKNFCDHCTSKGFRHRKDCTRPQ